MSSLVLSGDTSGTVTLAAPAVAGSNTITVQAATATMSVNTLATSVASTSGTSIDFTGIPSWAKRITVMLNGVSTSGSSLPRIQLGSGSPTTSGYLGAQINVTSGQATGGSNLSAGFDIQAFSPSASSLYSGAVTFTLTSGNNWTGTGLVGQQASASLGIVSGYVPLSGVLDRVRITTVNGTDTFDAGTINILYEG